MRKINYSRILYTIMSLLLLVFVGYISLVNIFPFKYIVIIFIIMALWDVALYFTLVFKTKVGKNIKRKIAGCIISVFLLAVMGIVGYYLINTMKFFKNFGANTYKEENYLILVKNDSSYTKLEDLNNIGYVKQEIGNMDKAIEQIQSRKQIEMIEYEQYNILMTSLIDSEIESLLIEQSYYEVIDETLNYSSYFKVLDTISIVTEIVEVTQEVESTSTPFTVYISGIDTYGSISGVSRSDVNMIATINPVTKQILFVSIPRDYYVQLHGTTGYKDKLTHAGVYGIDTSITTIEDLLEVDINYYFRVNFSTLEKVVDAIDGVDVYSEYTFTSHPYSGGTYHFTKGYNHLNGKQALCFSRERYNLPHGDRDRGMNQQAVLDGVVRKAISPTIITKYTSILNSLEGSFQTNMTEEEVQKLIKMQLNDMASWNITSYRLDGYDGDYEYTYSNPYQKLYVMHPLEETVTEAKKMIDNVYGGELLASSYGEVGNINNPVEVAPPPVILEPEVPVEDCTCEEEPCECEQNDDIEQLPNESTDEENNNEQTSDSPTDEENDDSNENISEPEIPGIPETPEIDDESQDTTIETPTDPEIPTEPEIPEVPEIPESNEEVKQPEESETPEAPEQTSPSEPTESSDTETNVEENS